MAAKMLLNTLVCLSLAVAAIDSFAVNIAVNPPQIHVASSPKLTIRCSVSGDATGITINSISMKFNKTSSISTKELAQVSRSSSASITDVPLQARATVDGEILSTTTSSYLTLLVNKNISCSDAGLYTCSVIKDTSSGRQTQETSAEVIGDSYPSWKEILHNPPRNKFAVNEEVRITCWGFVGKPAGSWSWDLYDNKTELWMPVNQGITQDPPIIISDCDYSRNSTLRYRVPDEKAKYFRCKLNDDTDLALYTTVNGKVSGVGITQASSILLLGCVLLGIRFRTR